MERMKSLEEEWNKRFWKKGIECRQVGEGNGVAGEDLEIERTIEERAWRRHSRAGEEKNYFHSNNPSFRPNKTARRFSEC